MKLKVTFRFNRTTGEIEEFRIDDDENAVIERDHDRRHDAAAAALGQLVARHARVEELPDGTEPITDGGEREAPAADPAQALPQRGTTRQ